MWPSHAQLIHLSAGSMVKMSCLEWMKPSNTPYARWPYTRALGSSREWEMNRWTDRQTDKQAERQTDRQTHSLRSTPVYKCVFVSPLQPPPIPSSVWGYNEAPYHDLASAVDCMLHDYENVLWYRVSVVCWWREKEEEGRNGRLSAQRRSSRASWWGDTTWERETGTIFSPYLFLLPLRGLPQ